MKDIFDANIMCPNCSHIMEKRNEVRNGYALRYARCPKCSEKMYHPLDLNKYKDYQDLKGRNFQVKLRMVGNSFSVTIPKEIIDFEEKFLQVEKEMDRMMRLSLEEPGRISLYFSKFFNNQEDEDEDEE